MQKDNSTLTQKVRLRRRVLAECAPAARVLETHGGYGRIFERTWFKTQGGVVIEKDDAKADHLAHQRPTWRVYQGDCEKVIAAGLAKSTPFDVVDLDPYGAPFPMLDALAQPGRVFPDVWHLVVNDGTRQATMRGIAWKMDALADQVRKYGTNLYPIYLQVARECVEAFAQRIGFELAAWVGYYTGTNNMMTHYWATLKRKSAETSGAPHGNAAVVNGAAAPASDSSTPPAKTSVGRA